MRGEVSNAGYDSRLSPVAFKRAWELVSIRLIRPGRVRKKTRGRFLREGKEPMLKQAAAHGSGSPGLPSPSCPEPNASQAVRGCGQEPLTSRIEASHRHRMQERTGAPIGCNWPRSNCIRSRILNASAAYVDHTQRVPPGSPPGRLMHLIAPHAPPSFSFSRRDTAAEHADMSVRTPNHARGVHAKGVAAGGCSTETRRLSLPSHRIAVPPPASWGWASSLQTT